MVYCLNNFKLIEKKKTPEKPCDLFFGILTFEYHFYFQIYVEFGSPDDSKNAAQSLAGRKFANRVVVTSFYSPEMYHRKEFH